ncbi:MAG: Hsp20/alpha crystallin family protein [Bradymonadaceae bacterium]|nr:Hsp20/alpha crystallin family protein [Lujinxingiaceae bacterium]
MLTRWNERNEMAPWSGGGFDNPMEMIEVFRRRLNRVFEEMGMGSIGAGAMNMGQLSALSGLEMGLAAGPRCYLYDTGSSFLIQAEVPGISEKDLDVMVNDQTLTIRGERKDDVPKGYSVHRRERMPMQFTRSFTLPAKVEASKATAELKHGLLTIEIEKTKESKPRQISVKTR